MRNRIFAHPALRRTLPVWLLFIFASAAAMLPVHTLADHLRRGYERNLLTIHFFPDDTLILAIRRVGIRYLILQPTYTDGGDHPSWQSVEATLASTLRRAVVARMEDYPIYKFLR